jgi:hypothetical protein
MDIPATEAATDFWVGFTKIKAVIQKRDSKVRQYSKIRNFAELQRAVSERANQPRLETADI